MPIKVAHVVRQYYPSVGGMEDVVQNIAQYQRACGDFEPKIVTLNRLFKNSARTLNSKESQGGIEIERLPYRGSSRYPLCPLVLQSIRDADLVHVHGIDFFFDYLAATRHIHRKPLVASTHGGFFHTNFMAGLKRMYFKTITRASSYSYDRIIATSNNDGEIFSKIIDDDKLVVIENGVNLSRYWDMAAQAPVPTMIYFGRWSQNKGIPEILALHAALVATQPQWRLIIAGREYDYRADELMAMAKNLGLDGKVNIVPNPDDKELGALIGQASYFICLSRHEGFGIAPIEAMSAGLIPILSDIPPFRALQSNSGTGITIATDALQSAVPRIQELHEAHVLDFDVNRRHAQRFVTRYDWNQIAEQYSDVYTNVVKH